MDNEHIEQLRDDVLDDFVERERMARRNPAPEGDLDDLKRSVAALLSCVSTQIAEIKEMLMLTQEKAISPMIKEIERIKLRLGMAVDDQGGTEQ